MPIKKSTIKKANVQSAKTSALSVDVFDVNGKVVESIELPKEIFGANSNPELISQAIRVYLANQRRGTVSTKTRGEVQGSTRKIYRQKGTGRARHGSIRAPIFVHGGIVFGPKPRDFSLAMPQQMRRKALFASLSGKKKDGEIKIVKGLEKIEQKTKSMVAVIKKLGLDLENKKILLVIPSASGFSNVTKAARNIKDLDYRQASQLNTYDVLNAKMLLLTRDSIEVLQQTFVKKE